MEWQAATRDFCHMQDFDKKISLIHRFKLFNMASSTTIQKELKIHTAELKKAAWIIRAVNHKRRQAILKFIQNNQPVIVSDIYKKLKLKQSIVSQHLAILRKTGFVKTERKGTFIHYKINYEKIEEIDLQIKKILN